MNRELAKLPPKKVLQKVAKTFLLRFEAAYNACPCKEGTSKKDATPASIEGDEATSIEGGNADAIEQESMQRHHSVFQQKTLELRKKLKTELLNVQV